MANSVQVSGTDVRSTQTVTFSGSTDSSAVDMSNESIVSITIPASMAGTSLKFLSSDTADGTYTTLRNGVDGTDVSFVITSTAGTYAAGTLLGALAGLRRFVKLKSGSSETGKTVTLNTRQV